MFTGGATMFGPAGNNDIGQRNIEAVKDRLGRHAIRLVAEHTVATGGRTYRRYRRDGSQIQLHRLANNA